MLGVEGSLFRMVLNKHIKVKKIYFFLVVYLFFIMQIFCFLILQIHANKKRQKQIFKQLFLLFRMNIN